MSFLHLVGDTGYAAVHAWMAARVDARARGEVGDVVLLLEHPSTLTVGRKRGAMDNLLAPEGVPVVEVERGGDVTWHGPGQLVAYPIVLLEGARRDLHLHLRALESAVIDVLAGVGLKGRRDVRNTGVWLPMPQGTPKKVCSVGIACRRWVTWHGLALNIDPSLAEFERIRPCGFDPSVMTRVADHLSPCPPVRAWVEPLARALADRLDLPFDGVATREIARA
ncbi:MAG: lipoyl(octanoyl) transferase LipB [Deltaproteobacteria bacterium]|nr:lipoyl(octanoyl) transferase LipB [Deltaproteobacteria bacterium]